MKKFSVILAVLFTLATTGQAFAFSGSAETNAQVYFAIPFGAQSKAEATPRFGFSVDYGQRLDDNGGLYGLQRIHRLDFRLNIAGDASFYSNGVNIGERINALYASDNDDFIDAWVMPLAVIGGGVAVFTLFKSIN
jgi:hypothetical protein